MLWNGITPIKKTYLSNIIAYFNICLEILAHYGKITQ